MQTCLLVYGKGMEAYVCSLAKNMQRCTYISKQPYLFPK